MNIYKANFPTEQQGKDYLLSIGVYKIVDSEIEYINGTQAVVNIGKVVDKTKTTDPENPIFYDGWAFDIMSTNTLSFGTFEVYPIEAAHSFFGYPKNEEVEPIEE